MKVKEFLERLELCEKKGKLVAIYSYTVCGKCNAVKRMFELAYMNKKTKQKEYVVCLEIEAEDRVHSAETSNSLIGVEEAISYIKTCNQEAKMGIRYSCFDIDTYKELEQVFEVPSNSEAGNQEDSMVFLSMSLMDNTDAEDADPEDREQVGEIK